MYGLVFISDIVMSDAIRYSATRIFASFWSVMCAVVVLNALLVVASWLLLTKDRYGVVLAVAALGLEALILLVFRLGLSCIPSVVVRSLWNLSSMGLWPRQQWTYPLIVLAIVAAVDQKRGLKGQGAQGWFGPQ